MIDLQPNSTSSTFNYVVWICVILRRILRVVRSRVPISKSEEAQEFWQTVLKEHPSGVKESFMKLPIDTCTLELHNSLLVWFSHLPERARPFTSLEQFANPFSLNFDDANLAWIYAAPAVEGTLLFLCSFCYLHMGSLDNLDSANKLYILGAPRYAELKLLPRANLYSSRQVILVVLRALAFILTRLKSSNPTSSYPSPVQYWSIQPLELFIIASSGLLATRVRFNILNFLGSPIPGT